MQWQLLEAQQHIHTRTQQHIHTVIQLPIHMLIQLRTHTPAQELTPVVATRTPFRREPTKPQASVAQPSSPSRTKATRMVEQTVEVATLTQLVVAPVVLLLVRV